MKPLSISLILLLSGCVGNDPIVFDSPDAGEPDAASETPQGSGSGGSGGSAVDPSRDGTGGASSASVTGSGGTGGIGGTQDDAGPSAGGASASSASSSSGVPAGCHPGGISCPPALPIGWYCDQGSPPPGPGCAWEGFSGGDLYCCPE